MGFFIKGNTFHGHIFLMDILGGGGGGGKYLSQRKLPQIIRICSKISCSHIIFIL